MSDSPLKVIIVGSGPAGLTAAHALSLADVEFVILEKRPTILEDIGASLVLSPASLRVLYQFGLADQLKQISAELEHVQSFTREGVKFKDTTSVQIYKEWFVLLPDNPVYNLTLLSFGDGLTIFHRADLVRALYQGLPETAKRNIIPGKDVKEVIQAEDSVTVTCADGTTYCGTIVIGADGVHSQCRREMRRIAVQSSLTADWEEEQPFEASYRCVWCSFDRPATAPAGFASDTQHKDQSIMFLSGKEKGWIFLYKKLPKPTRERARYTPEDIKGVASQFWDWPITDSLKVEDVFNLATAGMSNLEEGIAKKWSIGRLVLVGDACHKFTPNAGLGLNNGIQDVVALCNQLLKQEYASGQKRHNIATVTDAFEKYQKSRLPTLRTDFAHSASVTRHHAWATTWDYITSRYILAISLVENILLRWLAIPAARKALVLDYCPPAKNEA